MSMRDRADELWAKPDLWPEIEQHLQEAVQDARKRLRFGWWMDADVLQEKFRLGESEHKRDWLDMDRSALLREIDAELMDLVLYHAMIRSRWVDASYTTDEDPGDETDQ